MLLFLKLIKCTLHIFDYEDQIKAIFTHIIVVFMGYLISIAKQLLMIHHQVKDPLMMMNHSVVQKDSSLETIIV